VEGTDWRDLLSQEVRRLEARADPLSAEKALALLRAIRCYETRVRHLTLRLDYRLARSLPGMSGRGLRR
jgi:hypothetical protein